MTATYGPYQYTKLSTPTTLRVIKLRPGYGDALNCDLVEVDPKLPEPFEAISWCWGDEPREEWSKDLVIHGQGTAHVFKISIKLEEALKALRHDASRGDHHVRTLWLAAICINQSNLEEKSAQIPLMAMIYGRATTVVIWLGESDHHSKRALDFIKSNVLELWQFDKLIQNDEGEDWSEHWISLIELMNRPWFSRRWVVQEVSLATNAVVQCGEQTITWQEFSDAVSLFIEAESNSQRLSQVMKTSVVHNNPQNYFGQLQASGAAVLVETTNNLFRRSKDGDREPISNLEYLVCSLSVFDATNPRDIIYALLAITKDAKPEIGSSAGDKRLGNGEPDHLEETRRKLRAWGKANFQKQSYRVDYEQDVVDIYKDFIVFAIGKAEKQRALDILCRPWARSVAVKADKSKKGKKKSKAYKAMEKTRGGRDAELALPSWICTLDNAAFAIGNRPNIGERMHRKNGDTLVGLPDIGGRNYNAAGGRAIATTQVSFYPCKEPGKEYFSMFAQGFILDRIGRVLDTSTLGNIPSSWRSMMGGDSLDDDFWRTLVADRGRNGKNPPAFYPRACEEVFSTGTDEGSIDTQRLIEESNCTIMAEFLRRVCAVVWNRRMTKTANQGRLGLFPSATETGDYICILYGCSVPVVMRKITKTDIQVREDISREEARLEKCIKLIQARFRARSLSRQLKTIRHRRLLGLHLFCCPLIGMPSTFNIACTLVCAYLISSTMALDIGAWLSSWLAVLFHTMSCSSTSMVTEPVQFYSSLAMLCCFFAGPMTMAILRMANRLYRSAVLRFRSRSSILDIMANNAIKPRHHYWKLVGECYIHGVMNGEAIQMQMKASMERNQRAGSEKDIGEKPKGSLPPEAKPGTGGKGKFNGKRDEKKPQRGTSEEERMYDVKRFEIR